MSKSNSAYLTVSQAAAALGVSERTVRRRCETGKLAARLETTDTGKTWLIEGAAIAADAAANVRPEDQDSSASGAVNMAAGADRAADNSEAALHRMQGYIARDMELAIARAVEAAQTPLLEEIRQLRAQVERLSESRQEAPQQAPEGSSVVESQPAAESAQRPALSTAPLWLRWFGIRLKW
jgi:excisionase family DNA binding protein